MNLLFVYLFSSLSRCSYCTSVAVILLASFLPPPISLSSRKSLSVKQSSPNFKSLWIISSPVVEAAGKDGGYLSQKFFIFATAVNFLLQMDILV